MLEWFHSLADPATWNAWSAITGVLGVGLAFTLALLGLLGKLGPAWRWLRGKEAPPQRVRIDTPDPEPEPATPPVRHFLNVPRGRAVIGREAELAELAEKLTAAGEVQITNSGAILAGQGGIGKSTLARAYAEAHAQDYDGVLWVSADTRQGVIDGLTALCTPLGLPVPEQAKEADALGALAKLGETGQRWLLIYDNVEGYDDFKGLEPPAPCHLIATTRQGTGWPGFAVMTAEVLDYDTEDGAAVRLLMEAAERDEGAAEARALAETLGGLPLALVMAGRLIAREGGSFDGYRHRVGEIIARAPRNEDYPESVIGAVSLSYERLSDAARLVADLFAWWDAEGLSAGLIHDAPKGDRWDAIRADLPAPVRALAEDAGAVRAAMEELADRSLISGAPDDAAMHRMTAAALRAMQADRAATDVEEAAVLLLAALYPSDVDASANWPLCRRLTPHVRALWQAGAAPPIAALDMLLNQSALYLDKIADYPGALEMARASLDLKSARLPEEHRDIALGHANLGAALERVGDREAALAALDRAVALNAAHRPGTSDLANSYDQQGGVLLEIGRAGDRAALARAAKASQRALALRRRLFGRRSEPVALAANNLGAVRDAQGRGAAAARLVGAALGIVRAVLPAGDARLGSALTNTGAMWVKAGRADRAEPLLDEALEVRRAAHDGDTAHPELRLAAGWLVDCLLVRASAGENRGAREMRARQLCAEFALDLAEPQSVALQYPDAPDPGAPD